MYLKKGNMKKVEINRQLSDVPYSASSDCFWKNVKILLHKLFNTANDLTVALWSPF